MIKRFFSIIMLLCGVCFSAAAQEFVIKDVEGPSFMCEGDLRDFMYADHVSDGPSKVRQKAGPDGAVINYRDRITNLPQYLHDFIDQYVEAGCEVLNGGTNWLSDPTMSDANANGYYHLLKEVTGTASFTFPAGSGADVIRQAASDAYKDILEEEYDILKSFLPYAFLSVNYDHPEIFWIGNKFNYGCSSGGSISYSPSGTGSVDYSIKLVFYLRGGSFDIRCTGVDTYNFRNTENLANGVQTFNNSVQTILEQCQTGSSRYEKLLFAHDWLTQHNCYNRYYPTYSQSQIGDMPWRPLGALEGNTGQHAPVCEGYARAFKVLCDAMNIPCILMSGNVHYKTSNGEHMWNYVQMESGKWYAIDVTWDDPSVSSYDAVSGYESHDWFLLGSTTPLDDGQTFIESHPEQWLDSHPSEGSYTWDLQPGPELSPLVWTPSIINTLTYIVDGEVYRTYELESGTPIVPEPEPTKEGYTFSGWSEIPEIMPDGDVIVTGFFIVNSYTLTYMVDDVEYASFSVEYGSEIIPEPEPVMEGYTFSGWNGLPETMPAYDVVVTGTFSINQYKLIYIVDGEEYKSYEVDYNSEIIPEEEPTREGYTFSGWSEIPAVMPAEDVIVTGSFIVNSYTLTYMVDDVEYASFSVEYGSEIIPEPEPVMEGYTFSGWNGLPETMPAYDVVVTGTFSINQYRLIYIVDGEEYKSYEVDYNSEIILEPEPVRKGMTFSGWGEVPETMPAYDVILTGTFSWSEETFDFVIYQVTDTLNNYASVIGNDNIFGDATIRLSVTIGGDIYAVTEIGIKAFACCEGLTSVIIPGSVTCIGDSAFLSCPMLTDVYCYAENVPETNSDVFESSPIALATLHVPRISKELYKAAFPWSGFGNIVSLEGDDPEPVLEKCASPTIAYQNGQLKFQCETEDVEFVSEITNEDIRKNFTAIVSLTATYNISVYASKPGFENSDTIRATLCWIDQQPITEGITDDDAVMEVKAQPVLIQSHGGIITVQGAAEGTEIAIYGIEGRKYGTAIAVEGGTSIETSLRPGSVAVIKIGEKTIKFLMK